MDQVIFAVEIVTGSGMESFVVGQNKIADIVEENGVFKIFNEMDEQLWEIRNCPVLVSYKKVGA